MKYELVILQRGIVKDNLQFKTKSAVKKWIAENILQISLAGRSISLYTL